jgi:membrane protein YdbS with pleckstrin-like domain
MFYTPVFYTAVLQIVLCFILLIYKVWSYQSKKDVILGMTNHLFWKWNCRRMLFSFYI